MNKNDLKNIWARYAARLITGEVWTPNGVVFHHFNDGVYKADGTRQPHPC